MNNTKNQGREPNKHSDPTSANLKNIKISIDALSNQIDAQRREDKERGQGDKIWLKRTAIAAIIYTAFTFLIMLVTGYQTYLVRSNNVVSQRAFISLAVRLGPLTFGASPTKMTLGSVAGALNESPTQIVSVSFISDITNSGNTGTKGLGFFMKCAQSYEDLKEPWSILYQGKLTPEKTPQFIGPHATVQATCGFSIDQVKAMAAGKLFGYLMMDATYQDRLVDEWHKTQMTMKIAQIRLVEGMGPSGLGLNQVEVILTTYGSHNCADEECPSL